MLFHTHLLLGIVIFLLTKDFFSGGNQLIFLFMILLGSILPDIDERRSRVNQWAGIIGKVVTFFSKHRGFFHSILFFVISFLIIRHFWNFYYAAGLFLGYTAHILGDGMTKMGVEIFYPFSRFRMRGPVKVGGLTEVIVILILAFLIAKEFL